MNAVSDHLLKISDLRIGVSSPHGVKELVCGVDLQLRRGEFFALVGESGSGKTLTAQAVLGFLPQPGGVLMGGEVLLEGRNLFSISERERESLRGKSVGLVFQEPGQALDPLMRIGRQLEESLRLHGVEEDLERRTREMVERVELPERVLRAWPHELSGGMQQRVVIAMAIAHHPSLLIADEPTTALDATIQAQVMELLNQLRRDLGMTVLFVTHNLALVAQHADRLAVMERGVIVEEGSVDSFFRSPQHPYSQRLLRAVPRLPSDDALRQAFDAEGTSSLNRVTSELLVELRGLKVHFPTKRNFWGRPTDWVRAVDGVDLKIHANEVLALVGESGSGKSTLGQTLLGLQRPTAGEIFLDGKLFADSSGVRAGDRAEQSALRQRFQIVFQDTASSLNPRATIEEILVRPMLHHRLCTPGEARGHALELLRLVELPEDSLFRFPHAFSGGQRQRIAIARALSLRPSLLVCDEIVSALDVTVQAQILELLRKIRRELGLAVLFIAHDLALVREFCDRVAVMWNGVVVEEGSASSLFAHPQHPYTRKLLSAVPRIAILPEREES